jgi:CRP-like cAMP-binding protein
MGPGISYDFNVVASVQGEVNGYGERLLRLIPIPKTQATIAQELGVTRQAVSSTVKRLTREGRIQRLPGGRIKAADRPVETP